MIKCSRRSILWRFSFISAANRCQWSYHSSRESSTTKIGTQKQKSGPNTLILLAALKDCSRSRDLQRGRTIHADAIECGKDSDRYVASTLVNMYAKCGSMSDAQKVFDKINRPDVVLWNSLMLGYVENDEGKTALELFGRMQSQGCALNERTYVAALKACAQVAGKATGKEADAKLVKLEMLQKGMAIHSQAAKGNGDIFVASALVNFYAKCGSMMDARMVFDRMPFHDMVSWTAIVLGYAENGEEMLALELFSNLPSEGSPPDAMLFVAALKACSSLAVKEEGKQVDGKLMKLITLEKGTAIHLQAIQHRCALNIFVASTLVDVYAKCGSMVNAQRVFDKMPCHNVVAWTALMLGYSENDESEMALDLFSRMQFASLSPDGASFVSALKACTAMAAKEEPMLVDGKPVKLEALERGMAIHSQAANCGCDSEVSVAISLVGMYAKCGSLLDACRIYDKMGTHNAVSSTALALGYAANGAGEQALELFAHSCRGDFLDAPTFVAALKACSSLAMKEKGKEIDGRLVKVEALEKGMSLHFQAVQGGFEADIYVSNTSIDMYAKCGSMVDARGVFDRTTGLHTLASWNALLLGYTENGEDELAWEVFEHMMKFSRLSPNARTFAIALRACGNMALLETVKATHGSICRYGLEVDTVLATVLVDVYGRCGNMAEAQHVFDSVAATKDLVMCTALLDGYSQQGDSNRVFELFHMMEEHGLEANEVTLVCLLTACSRAGLVERGKKYFEMIHSKYGVSPSVEHYLCMVDLLGRANQLEAAVEMVKNTPMIKHNPLAWTTVLGACRKWKNVEIGKTAFEWSLRLDGQQSAAYDLMANLYGSA